MIVLESVYGTLNNAEIDMVDGKVTNVECPLPIPFKARNNISLVPTVCNEWTIIIIEGPKKIAQII